MLKDSILLGVTLCVLFSVASGARSAMPIGSGHVRHASPQLTRAHPMNQGPLVNVTGGLIAGETTLTGSVYLGVPFSAPPTGSNRFQPPQPVQPWSVPILDATQYKPACPQPVGGLDPIPTSAQNEDCLYLNVYTPVNSSGGQPPPTGPLPVLLWFYGGSFIHGAASVPLYNGSILASEGAVVVTANYRLGALGFGVSSLFGSPGNNGKSGNYGLLDQQKAMEWVQNNIAAFGGDPRRVTIFGESAGAISTCFQTVSPLAKGLFLRAIMESGPCTQGTDGPQVYPRKTYNYEASASQTAAMLSNLGCTTLACAQQANVADILKYQGAKWSPVVDGYVVPDDPYKLYQSGSVNPQQIMIGSNENDGSLFTPKTVTAQNYAATLNTAFGQYASQVAAAYPLGSAPTSAFQTYAQIVTDFYFLCPGQYMSTQGSTSAGLVSFVYLWAHVPSWVKCPGNPFCNLGVFHSSEIAFVFGYESDKLTMTPAEQALSKQMRAQWIQFAAVGNPSIHNVNWPVYPTPNPSTLVLNISESAPIQAYRREYCSFWQSITDKDGEFKSKLPVFDFVEPDM